MDKFDRLVNKMKSSFKLMSHKDIVKFLLKCANIKYTDRTRTYFDPQLYGRGSNVGFFKKRCANHGYGFYTIKS